MSLRRWMAALLLMLLAAPAAAQEFAGVFPPALRFTQRTKTQEVAEDIYIKRTYPATQSAAVNEEMRALIDRMTEENEKRLPRERVTTPSYLDVGAMVSRSGESALSFLTIASVSRETRQRSVEFDARVYDIEQGRRLTLADFFGEDDGAYAYIAQQARAQLGAAFPGLEPDATALEGLLAGVRSAPFTLGAARMTLTYRADAIYPGKASLLHVHLYYPDIRPMMTPYGLRQTDNSRYKMVALTYDDGGARGTTRAVLDHLRNYGAQATFFVVGERFAGNHANLLRQQDSKHSIQNHTFSHRYPGELKPGEAEAEKRQMEQLLGEITGVVPTMMRAPGGQCQYYMNREIGYPMIQWSVSSADAGNPDHEKIARRVRNAGDGSVVLMHDINPYSPLYTQEILSYFADHGVMCVTVEELFCDAGVALEANKAYKSPYHIEW